MTGSHERTIRTSGGRPPEEAPAAGSRPPAARPPASRMPPASPADGTDQGPVTLEDVARVAGVHYSTVSRALDPAKAWRVGASTRRHVETVALEMGYRRHMGASGLKRGRTHTVGVIVADLGNPFISPVLRGLANRLDEANLMPLITETQDDPARLSRVLNHVLERRVDAVVVGAARLGQRADPDGGGQQAGAAAPVRPQRAADRPALVHARSPAGRQPGRAPICWNSGTAGSPSCAGPPTSARSWTGGAASRRRWPGGGHRDRPAGRGVQARPRRGPPAGPDAARPAGRRCPRRSSRTTT